MNTQKRNLTMFIILTIIIDSLSYYFLTYIENISNLFLLGITISLILIVPFFYYILMLRKKYLKPITIAPIFIIQYFYSSFIIPDSKKEYLDLSMYVAVIFEITLAVFVIYKVARMVKKYKETNRDGLHVLDALRNGFVELFGESKFVDLAVKDLAIYYYAFFVWFKKPSVNKELSFTYHKNSDIKVFVIIALIIGTIEVVGVHILLSHWNTIIAWVITVLSIYGLVYLVGLYNSVRYSPIVIEDNRMVIRVGFQSSLIVDFENIEAFEPAGANYDEKAKKEKKTTYTAIVLRTNQPQFEVTLKNPVPQIGLFGMEKLISTVYIMVDNPRDFAKAVNSKMIERYPETSQN
ncbi:MULTISPECIES: hypothetical protein [unclassified Bacillus (in: firmicutes)]|uniref:hypothetical protein n=1 Tax=unclassified Bacillus (in: firmicutes) TaxID=185979 RepID=UPI000BF8BB1C|nr:MULTISPECIES: hypothetical protein [unclassified Bacillus (in: firmicutes)]PEU19239.1 hypothetical protein CN525_08195 [Bacillus sp. AFS014408]PFW61608.1 hypothetical protein COL20_16650 [Bacillus sp. AFS075034]